MRRRSRLTALLVMGVLLVVATAAPAFAVQPFCEPNLGINCGASLEHRANASGKGNFGQCHEASGGFIEGQLSSMVNPSSQNVGEADCRTASGRETTFVQAVALRAFCEPPSEPVAESQITFQPEIFAETRTGCQ